MFFFAGTLVGYSAGQKHEIESEKMKEKPQRAPQPTKDAALIGIPLNRKTHNTFQPNQRTPSKEAIEQSHQYKN